MTGKLDVFRAKACLYRLHRKVDTEIWLGWQRMKGQHASAGDSSSGWHIGPANRGCSSGLRLQLSSSAQSPTRRFLWLSMDRKMLSQGRPVHPAHRGGRN